MKRLAMLKRPYFDDRRWKLFGPAANASAAATATPPQPKVAINAGPKK